MGFFRKERNLTSINPSICFSTRKDGENGDSERKRERKIEIGREKEVRDRAWRGIEGQCSGAGAANAVVVA